MHYLSVTEILGQVVAEILAVERDEIVETEHWSGVISHGPAIDHLVRFSDDVCIDLPWPDEFDRRLPIRTIPETVNSHVRPISGTDTENAVIDIVSSEYLPTVGLRIGGGRVLAGDSVIPNQFAIAVHTIGTFLEEDDFSSVITRR